MQLSCRQGCGVCEAHVHMAHGVSSRGPSVPFPPTYTLLCVPPPQESDFITVHVPYIKGVTHHMINANNLKLCRPGVHLLNFARGEIIEGEAVKDMWDSGKMTGEAQGFEARAASHNSSSRGHVGRGQG